MNKQGVKNYIGIVIGLILSFNVGLYAWSGIQAQDGDKLSVAKWNEMTSGVWGRFGAAMHYTGGNVGIGTSAPTQKLDIAGYAKIDGAWFFNDTNGFDGDKWGFYGRDDKFVISKRDSSYTWVKDVINIRENGFVHYGNFNGEVSNIISNTNSGNNSYSILRLNANGSSDGVIFKNSSTRSSDGGINTMTVRNDGGDLVLGGNFKTIINPAGGNVGIGTNIPDHKLHISGDIRLDTDKVFRFGSIGENSDDFFFKRVNNSGDISNLILYLGDNNTLQNDYFSIQASQNSYDNNRIEAHKFWSNGDAFHIGNLQAKGYSNISDQRYKKDIKTIESPLDKISKLRGVTFNWKTGEFKDKNFPKGNQVGFIAQEVEKVLPQIVTTDKDGYKSVQYSNVTAVLVEAVKELKKENEDLKEKDLEKTKEIQKLIKRIENLEIK